MARIEDLLNEVDSQNEETLIFYFIRDLVVEIKRQLKLNRPNTLRKALAIAKVHEENKGYKAYKYRGPPYNSKSEPIIKTSPPASSVPIVRRTLTAEERTAKGCASTIMRSMHRDINVRVDCSV